MIYLDHAATTPVCPQAAAAALAAMTDGFGNPSSLYPLGKEAAAQVRDGRAQIAQALGCLSEEVFFTSCGTEGDNWAIRGAVALGGRKGRHIITSSIEHSAVLEQCKALERQGFDVTYLKPDKTGHITADQVAAALRPDTVLVSIMLVNNELGTVQPLGAIARAIKESGHTPLLHTDAVQGFLKLPFTPEELGVDLLTISGHKVCAPKGIGALYIRKGLKLPPLFLGGGQESGLRPGTEPTAQIAAFAAAVGVWSVEKLSHMRQIRAYAKETLLTLDGVALVGEGDAPHILALSLPGYPSEMLVRALGDKGIYVSAGSACHRGKPSHVFAALGLPKQTLMGVLRISFSGETSVEEIDALRAALGEIMSTRISMK